MIDSLKMKSRRKTREPLSKNIVPYKPTPTNYNVPTVSEFKRKQIVEKILRQRRMVNTIAWWFAVITCILIAWAFM